MVLICSSNAHLSSEAGSVLWIDSCDPRVNTLSCNPILNTSISTSFSQITHPVMNKSETRKILSLAVSSLERILVHITCSYSLFYSEITKKLITQKVNVPNLVTYLDKTPIFDWCVIRCGSKNGHQKKKCLKEIGLHAQYLLTILGPIVSIIWGTYLVLLWFWQFCL